MNNNESIVYPAEVIQCLTEKSIALIGFNQQDAGRLLEALAPFKVFTDRFAHCEATPGSPKLRQFDLLVIQVPDQLEEFEWLTASAAAQNSQPLLFTGHCEVLLQQVPGKHSSLYHFLAFTWPPEEVVLRVYHALSAPLPQANAKRSRPIEGKARVLIADDDPTIVTMVRAVLVKHGMECLVAQNGGVAVTLAKAHHPHAAIVDINMPFLDGFEVLHSIKNDPQTRDIAVILLTSLKQESDIVRGFSLGADDYVVKPFRPLELAARLKRLLQRSAA